ncbi:hypothetical protein ABID12_004130 [Martelella mangrovi]|uniref:DUF1376 domain-containing protein n=1 Tax=Martelella mangrovi TaxID=1397477 RepID=A0ABV2IIX9_9HYPH
MSDIATLIADMVRGGVDPDLIGRTAAALAERGPEITPDDGDDDARRARNRRYYERKKASEKRLNKTVSDDIKTFKTVSDEGQKEISPCTPFQKKTPLKENPPKGGQKKNPPEADTRLFGDDGKDRRKRGDVSGLVDEFDRDVWPIYPHKVAKPAALKAWCSARQRAERDTIMAGLNRYVAKQDDRPWCNLSTWLNQDRWNDRPATSPARAPPVSGGRERMRDRQERAIRNLRGDDERDHGKTIDIAAGDYAAE